MRKTLGTVFLSLLASTIVLAQTATQETVPIYKITVIGRTVKAINYRHRSGKTKVDFRGTSLMPQAAGDAEVESKPGATQIDADMKHLDPASKFGPEYLTYVLWAITPEGRPVNLGEVLLNDSRNCKLNVTSDLQSFGLIVTAEPYFGVTQPSDVVVMENMITDQTHGTIEEVDAKYELLQRGQYTVMASPQQVRPLVVEHNAPLELYEAQNAVRIAEWFGARQYAADTLRKARMDLASAETLAGSKDWKDLITQARESVQNAEDARLIAVKKMEREQQAQQQAQASQAVANAQAQAQQSQAQAESEAQARAQAEAAKAAAEQQQLQAQAQAAQAQAAQSQSEAEQARQQAAQAEQEKLAMRARLLQQLNAILQTRDTSRGLVVSMSDILFETGQYRLKSGAREALAKIAGVLLTYPGLTLEVDGFTDNVGAEDTNQPLSEKRAEAVRQFLVQQGVPANSITAQGLGEANPVAANDTPVGRQLNRRVELVLAGDLIGAKIGTATAQSSPGSL